MRDLYEQWADDATNRVLNKVSEKNSNALMDGDIGGFIWDFLAQLMERCQERRNAPSPEEMAQSIRNPGRRQQRQMRRVARQTLPGEAYHQYSNDIISGTIEAASETDEDEIVSLIRATADE